MENELAGENVQSTYLRKLLDTLGARGVVLLAALPIVTVVGSYSPETVGQPVAGFLLALALGGAFLFDDRWFPDEELDTVGISLIVVVVVYSLVKALGFAFSWPIAVLSAAFVFGAVVYDYLTDDYDTETVQYTEADVIRVDAVGLIAAETLLFYTILRAAGWMEFAHSATFGVIVFILYTATVSAFAGYNVVNRQSGEITIDDEMYDKIVGVVREVRDVEDDGVRNALATKIRLMIEGLEGVKLPTEIEDRYGEIPIILPTHAPAAMRTQVPTEEVIGEAKETEFTGYVVHGDRVLLFRNGALFKYYHDGDYGYEAEDLPTTVADTTYHELGHSSLNEIDDLTPKREMVVTPDEAKEKREAERTTSSDEILEVGGNQINIDEMFERADEVIEEIERSG